MEDDADADAGDTGDGAEVAVTDAGPGVPAGEAALQRGHRGAGSTGLGLDIARRSAERSGDRQRVASAAAGTGITLELGPPAG